MAIRAECGELSAGEKEMRHEGMGNRKEIRTEGTLWRERLERAATEIQAMGGCCHHGEWLR